MKERGRKLAPERKALLEQCVLDGWPIRQIIQTHGFGTRTVKKHHPDYHGMCAEDSGKLSMAIQKLDRKLEHR